MMTTTTTRGNREGMKKMWKRVKWVSVWRRSRVAVWENCSVWPLLAAATARFAMRNGSKEKEEKNWKYFSFKICIADEYRTGVVCYAEWILRPG